MFDSLPEFFKNMSFGTMIIFFGVLDMFVSSLVFAFLLFVDGRLGLFMLIALLPGALVAVYGGLMNLWYPHYAAKGSRKE